MLPIGILNSWVCLQNFPVAFIRNEQCNAFESRLTGDDLNGRYVNKGSEVVTSLGHLQSLPNARFQENGASLNSL